MKKLKSLLGFALLGLAVAVLAADSAPYADHSGAITSGGTAQTVAPVNQTRRYFIFQNISDTDMWINFGGVAVADKPSVKIVAGGNYEPLVPSTQLVSVYCATTGKKFVCKEI